MTTLILKTAFLLQIASNLYNYWASKAVLSQKCLRPVFIIFITLRCR